MLLAALAIRELRARPEVEADSAAGAALPGALVRWTIRAPAEAVVTLESPPTVVDRAWLAAVRNAGTPVRWRAPSMRAIAVATERSPAPSEWVRVSVAAPDSATIVVSDAAAALDTVVARAGGVMVTLPALWGQARAAIGDWSATTTAPGVIVPRRILLVGGAGWESKFLIAALEESDWKVDASFGLRPGTDVEQGRAASPDTAQHAAVIVLDSIPPALATSIASYVRDGGGLLLGPRAWTTPAFRDLLAGRGERAIPARPGTTRQTLATVGVQTLVPVRGASALAQRGSEPVVVARRVESGRVVQVGYDESWRWRMTGPDGSVEAHRDWWSRLVSTVAYAPYQQPVPQPAADEAPLANLVSALGQPSGVTARTTRSPASSPALLLLSFLLLLGEIGSRRLRGSR